MNMMRMGVIRRGPRTRMGVALTRPMSSKPPPGTVEKLVDGATLGIIVFAAVNLAALLPQIFAHKR